jgi:hypothetical protein
VGEAGDILYELSFKRGHEDDVAMEFKINVLFPRSGHQRQPVPYAQGLLRRNRGEQEATILGDLQLL